MGRHSSRSRLVQVMLFSLLLVATTAIAKKRPAKREYDSHTYYVLELDPALLPPSTSPQDIASALGAEHVEQVGELANEYLIRAPQDLVKRGESTWTSNVSGALEKRDVNRVPERDLVMERYDLLRRGQGPATRIRARSVEGNGSTPLVRRLRASAIRSLERQYPSLRAKRDFPVPPSDWDSSLAPRFVPVRPYERSPATYHPFRQTAPPSTLISDMAELLGIQDPLWPKQWHLVNGIIEQNSINITDVWLDGIQGQGINVAIVDDGLDMHSDDLAPNFHADGSWDYNDNTALPEPRLSDDQHGTRCAGEVAAAKNDVCGVGVAHRSGIAGIRILSASISDADEASALNYGFQTNDIYSCSWGPPDDGKSMEAPGRLIVKAMLNGVQNGRAGKGSIYVFASGNGGANDDQCNFDGYTNSLMSITVGAIDRKGLHPYYSEACAAIMVVTYSSGSGDSIHTTDVGKNVCTDRHGGTSAAAPIAAGIFALVLQVRPDLTWRDMQHLCVLTAVQVNPNDPDWQMTASGRNFNHKYGFGKLDAWAIVNAAKTWELVKPQTWWASEVVRSGEALTADGVVATIEVTQADLENANFQLLEHVTINVHIRHQRRGNVEVELDSARGMKSILARPRRLDDSESGIPNWTFMTVKHWDEDPVGTWTLRVRDRQTNGKNGTFGSWSMTLWGSAIDASKAELWKMPGPTKGDEDEVEEGSETSEPTDATDTNPGATPTATAPAEETEAPPSGVKTLVKPTAHLPEDHKEAEGEAHSSFGEPAAPVATPEPTPQPEIPHEDVVQETPTVDAPQATMIGDPEYYDEDSPGYLAALPALLANSTWMFVAAGTIIVFVAGVSAFFILRRRKSGRLGRVGGYEFAPETDDEEGVAMGTIGRSGPLMIGERGRTRDLYDAFAIDGSDSEGESEDEGDGLVPKSRVRTEEAYPDEHRAFLDNPETPLAASHPVQGTPSAL